MSAEHELKKQTRIMIEEKAGIARTGGGIAGFFLAIVSVSLFTKHVVDLHPLVMLVYIVAVTALLARWAGKAETERLSR